MKGFVDDIAVLAEKNADFRRVLYTAKNLQLVLMVLPPGEDIGEAPKPPKRISTSRRPNNTDDRESNNDRSFEEKEYEQESEDSDYRGAGGLRDRPGQHDRNG